MEVNEITRILAPHAARRPEVSTQDTTRLSFTVEDFETSPARAAIPELAEVSIELFLNALADSGLVSDEEVAGLWARVGALDSSDSARSLASELARRGTLTDYQASALLHGGQSPVVIDDFLVLEIIGVGGISTIYRARDRWTGQEFALKVLSSDDDPSRQWKERFIREGRAMARLEHPNVVKSHAAVHRPDIDYFVLEYVRGENLDDYIARQGRIPLKRATKFLAEAARGLAHAHSRQIVHRDIKPGNLLVSKEGSVKVLDLGLVRFASAVGGWNEPANDRLTKEGTLMGTPHYMAPEQVLDARSADHRSDIYGLGCTFCYLLTGRPPYHGSTVMATLQAHQNSPIPRLRQWRDDVPSALQAIFERMIAKKPEDRYGSLEELLEDLADFEEGRLAPKRRRPWWQFWAS
jgi:serine/threonine protein kinase